MSDNALDVFADRLGQTGRRNADDLRMIESDQVRETFFQVVLSSENSPVLGQGGGGDIDRLVVMSRHMPPDIGRAAL